MLEELDGIDWSALTHAYGPAVDVPGNLRGLASNSRVARAASLDALWGSIHHQGTIYGATPPTTHFLTTLLESPGPQDRPAILGLLVALARGESSQPSVLHATRKAFLRGRRTYVSMLDARLPHERAHAGHAVEATAELLPRARPALARALRQRFDREPKEYVRASLAFALGALGSERKAITSVAGPGARSRLVRLAASLGGARAGRIQPVSLQLLVDAIADPSKLAATYDELPQRDNGLPDDACVALRRLGSSATAALGLLLDALPAVEALNTTPVLEAILWLAMPPSATPRTAASLRAEERRALERITKCANVWRAKTERLVRASALAVHGLPADHEALTAFLAVR